MAATRPAPADDALPEDAPISRHLIAVSSALRVYAREALEARGHDLTAAITLIVTNLPAEGLGMSALARRAGVSLQRAGQLVAELEDAGYVERVSEEHDGRARRAIYTRRGRRLLRDIDAVNDEIEERLSEVLGPERLERLSEDLAELDAALGSAEGLRIVVG